MQKNYSIQGFTGSFHEEAAQKYFNKNVNVICCANFKQTFDEATTNKACDGAIVAIENSIAGSILPNYTLLKKSKLHIVGEIFLKIKQQLLVNKGITLVQIKEVHSHPMALLQCTNFLEQHKFKLVEKEDTALSAKYIKQHQCKHIAAIASTLAAQQNDLEILVPNIHTEKNNLTRFLILEQKPNTLNEQYNKASVYLETNHQKGSLAKLLSLIAAQGINLSKLQSFPIAGSNFKYYFHVDMEFDHIEQFIKIDKILKEKTIRYKVYGIYKKGKTL
jgi:prephenate dehydratase